MMRALSLLKTTISRFSNDRGGNFAMVTALIATPLLLAGGAAIDFSNASTQRTNLQEIADATALEGGKIFDGTNLAAATTTAQAFLKGYSAQMPSNVKSSMTADGRTFKVALTAAVDTSLMKIANYNSIPISADAAAIAPMKPQKITLTPTNAQGFWYKVVSIIVVRPDTTAEVVLGTYTYQPTTQTNSGQGTKVMSPSGAIDLGKYTKLVLKMDIKTDGCPLGAYATVNSKKDVTCNVIDPKDKNKSQYSGYFSYNNTLRTDNPDTSNYLFVDGKQMPQGINFPLEKYFGCAKPQSHAWEDGGGWDRQDIFYTISSDCTATDSNYVRLTQ
jgi:Flp pilus assembly protein TadG